MVWCGFNPWAGSLNSGVTTKTWRTFLQKVMIALELPANIPADDLAQQVADLILEDLGARLVTLRITTSTGSLILE